MSGDILPSWHFANREKSEWQNSLFSVAALRYCTSYQAKVEAKNTKATAETAEYKPEAIQRPSLQWNVFLLVHGDHTLVVHAKSSDRALHHCIHRLTLDKIVESLSTKG